MEAQIILCSFVHHGSDAVSGTSRAIYIYGLYPRTYQRSPNMLLPRTSPHLSSPPATATAFTSPTTTAKHTCWLHNLPMSLWLSTPSISITDIQATLLESVQFPSHSSMFIFLWTVFVTAVVLLLLAISATYRNNGNNQPQGLSFAERFKRPSFRAIKWSDVEGGELTLRIGIDESLGRKGGQIVV